MGRKIVISLMILSFVIVPAGQVFAAEKNQDEIDEDRQQMAVVAIGIVAVLGSIWLLRNMNSPKFSSEFNRKCLKRDERPLNLIAHKRLPKGRHLYLKLDSDRIDSSAYGKGVSYRDEKQEYRPILKMVYTW